MVEVLGMIDIAELQKRVGANPDGFWGPRSVAACQAHLRAMMPHPNPAPRSDEKSLLAFYGRPGDESKLERMDFPIPMFYDGKPVKSTRVHRECSPSLLDVFVEIHDRYGSDKRIMRAATTYDGCFNDRAMRGGSTPSLHARGAAIDLDAANNGNRTHWPTVATMPIEIMEVFSRHGWLSAGAFWSRDAAHFQMTT